MIITRWKNLVTPTGTEQRIPWAEFCEEFSKLRKFESDNRHPGWSPARFSDGKRSKETVERVFAVCLDYDQGETLEHAEQLWGGYCCLLHTTRKHTADAPRFRVILPLKRSVSVYEFVGLWERVNAHAGGKLDPSPKDPSRFWFVPGVGDHDGAEFVAKRYDGPPLDPDEWLAKPDPRPPATTDDVLRAELDAASAYATAALDAEEHAMSEAREGERNATLNRCAFALGQLVAGGVLEESTVEARLTAAARSVGLKDREIRSTLRSGLASGKKHPRGVPERTDIDRRHCTDPTDWEAYYAQQRESLVQDVPTEAEEPPRESDKAEKEPQTEEPQQNAFERYTVLSMIDLLSYTVVQLKSPERARGVPTGLEELDEAIGGYRPGNITILGGKRSFGKTSLSIRAVEEAMRVNARVLLFGGEDSKLMYGKRFMALRARVNATRLRDNDCSEEDFAKMAHAIAGASNEPFFVNAIGKPVEWIAEVIRAVAKEVQLALVIGDYLQRFKARRRQQDRRNHVSYVCSTLVDTIREVNAAGLLLSQLKRTEKRLPEIEDLKESGDIEDMADHILLGRKTKDGRYISVAKNKDGPDAEAIEDIEVPFDPATASMGRRYGSGHSRWDYKSAAAGDP